MSYAKIKNVVCQLNRDLAKTGLVILTFGNASAVDRKAGVMAIKPSGVGYDALKPNDIVVLSLKDGKVLEGKRRPSSDTPTHLHLYQSFTDIGAIIHTHALNATIWAQAGREIPCFGTTHADHFYGPIPVTRQLEKSEISSDYELNTGRVIVEHFKSTRLSSTEMPAVLVRGHAPFTWGSTPAKALENAVALETVATMALRALALAPDLRPIRQSLLDKHFRRKHGPAAYYGQP